MYIYLYIRSLQRYKPLDSHCNSGLHDPREVLGIALSKLLLWLRFVLHAAIYKTLIHGGEAISLVEMRHFALKPAWELLLEQQGAIARLFRRRQVSGALTGRARDVTACPEKGHTPNTTGSRSRRA